MKPFSVSLEPPEGFHAQVEVAGCYCSSGDKILFLLRQPHKPQGETWGVPAGKLEAGEDPEGAVIREVKEEVGLDIGGEGLNHLGALYCRLPHMDYIFHMFHRDFSTLPDIDLAISEHVEFRWVTKDEAQKLPLIVHGHDALHHFVRLSDKTKKCYSDRNPLNHS